MHFHFLRHFVQPCIWNTFVVYKTTSIIVQVVWESVHVQFDLLLTSDNHPPEANSWAGDLTVAKKLKVVLNFSAFYQEAIWICIWSSPSGSISLLWYILACQKSSRTTRRRSRRWPQMIKSHHVQQIPRLGLNFSAWCKIVNWGPWWVHWFFLSFYSGFPRPKFKARVNFYF